MFASIYPRILVTIGEIIVYIPILVVKDLQQDYILGELYLYRASYYIDRSPSRRILYTISSEDRKNTAVFEAAIGFSRIINFEKLIILRQSENSQADQQLGLNPPILLENLSLLVGLVVVSIVIYRDEIRKIDSLDYLLRTLEQESLILRLRTYRPELSRLTLSQGPQIEEKPYSRPAHPQATEGGILQTLLPPLIYYDSRIKLIFKGSRNLPFTLVRIIDEHSALPVTLTFLLSISIDRRRLIRYINKKPIKFNQQRIQKLRIVVPLAAYRTRKNALLYDSINNLRGGYSNRDSTTTYSSPGIQRSQQAIG